MENVDTDDDSGRYTTKSLNELIDEVITKPMHSNVEKNRSEIQKCDEQISG